MNPVRPIAYRAFARGLLSPRAFLEAMIGKRFTARLLAQPTIEAPLVCDTCGKPVWFRDAEADRLAICYDCYRAIGDGVYDEEGNPID